MTGAAHWLNPWLLLSAGFAAALLMRGAGVLLSGRIEPIRPCSIGLHVSAKLWSAA